MSTAINDALIRDVVSEVLSRLQTSGENGGPASGVRAGKPTVAPMGGADGVFQTVDAAENPFLHGVLRAFDALTGCPVMINTSFNVRGEPPVCHPREAIDGFLHTGMDALALGPFWVEKAALPAALLPAAPPRTFAPD